MSEDRKSPTEQRTKFRQRGSVWCDSLPMYDGWTGKLIGRFGGMHIVCAMPEDGLCPTCGSKLGETQ